jgi:hypothetical protein
VRKTAWFHERFQAGVSLSRYFDERRRTMEDVLGKEAVSDNRAPCLLPGSGDVDLPEGSTHTPAPNAPTFIKKFDRTLNRAVWKFHAPAPKE